MLHPYRRTTPATLLIAAALPLLLALPAFAQLPSATPIPTTPQTISGTVTNAISGQAVFRALVRLTGSGNQRAMLTDSLGHFSFAEVTPGATLNLTAIKPGFSFAQNPGDPNQLTLTPDSFADPVQLRVFPEAILKGTVISPEGEPVPNIEITAFRSILDNTGRHWMYAARARSNTHGQFRLPVTAGDYSVETGFHSTSSSSAILPTILPQAGASLATQTIRVRSGDQLELDLHPPFAPLVSVNAHLDRDAGEIGSLTAILRDGTSFPVFFNVLDDSDIRLNLPPGNFVLQTRHRGFGGDAVEQASISVAASSTPTTTSLQFAPVAAIPIDISIDSAALSAATAAGQTLDIPNPRLLGLLLDPDDSVPSLGSDQVRPVDRRNEPTSFVAPPGNYRLRSSAGTWYVLSATYGGSDLLSHDLLVTPGTGVTPLQIVVSNQTASLSGNVTLDGKPASCWIYLIASSPSTAPSMTLRSGSQGTFNDTYLPPGSYNIIAFAHRHPIDPTDPKALTPYATHVGSITLQPGDKPSLSLEAVPDSEIQP
jgi:hypothetical protein